MSKLRVHAFSVSLDGFGAGQDQSLDDPLGRGGTRLHDWVFPTRAFRAMTGQPGGETGVADDLATRGFDRIGAHILGRNMFGPVRGPWPDDTWRGWWGEAPPYHCPVFVLTNHARPALTMQGGTVFHFVTGGKDVRLGGGVATLRAYLQARKVDEMHLAFAPVLLGAGEALFPSLDLPALGYRITRSVATEAAMHVLFERED